MYHTPTRLDVIEVEAPLIHRLILISLLTLSLGTAVAAQSAKPQRAAGRVDAVSAETVTITAGSTKLVIKVDKSTKVTGRGAEARGARDGQKPVQELVQANDSVVVTYSGATPESLLASEIHVRQVTK